MIKELVIDKEYRITLPEDTRIRLGAKPGAKVRLQDMPDGSLILKSTVSILDLYGCIETNGIHASVEEMNEAIEKEAAKLAGC